MALDLGSSKGPIVDGTERFFKMKAIIGIIYIEVVDRITKKGRATKSPELKIDSQSGMMKFMI